MNILRLTIHPAGPDRFDARLPDGRLLLSACHDPLTDAATLLAEMGIDPAVQILIRHAGATFDAMRGTIGALAGKTIKEGGGGPRYHPRRMGSPTCATSPPLGVSDVAGMIVPDDGSFKPARAKTRVATSPAPPQVES